MTPPEDCRRIAAATSSRTFRELPGLGHACYAEAPAAVDEVIVALAIEAGALHG